MEEEEEREEEDNLAFLQYVDVCRLKDCCIKMSKSRLNDEPCSSKAKEDILKSLYLSTAQFNSIYCHRKAEVIASDGLRERKH